ncbi:3'-5' exoribonuclease [Paenalkalicoccus suaedae]|uniref:3'-5' exoribonuclease n=1 Tax=Paenalkalicoccus suaedae TaxID=2592382 RepID=A0A859FEJ8_9BACI|nr:exonuclease domain-containing protein [Paenalkalicoccus suaedae]QKS71268.1 3'-5' exoribonuclease [Paenalkalicoccus suaedae]
MNAMDRFMRQLTGFVQPNSYKSKERDPAKIAYARRLQKASRKQAHLEMPFDQLPTVIFDLETTGFHPTKGDTILSIGAKKLVGQEEVGEFYSLVYHEEDPPAHIQELTGLTLTDLKEAPTMDEVLPQFFEFIHEHTLVAHHAMHEKKFMEHVTWNLYKSSFDYRLLDTSFLTKLIPEMKSLHSLEECCSYFDIDFNERHHALADATVTAELWNQSIEKVKSLGYHTLRDVYTYIARTR